MTAISNVFCKYYIACASDSFIVELCDGPQGGEPLKYIEASQAKIVPIERLKGAVSYWGFAKYSSISTLDEIKRVVGDQAYSTLEEFAVGLRDHFNTLFEKHPAIRKTDRGVGFHVVGYEDVEGTPVPELYLVTNYKSLAYDDLSDRLGCSRRSYVTLNPEGSGDDDYLKRHSEGEFRKKVYGHLDDGHIIYFNNGDPALFTLAADAVLESMKTLSKRGALESPENAWRELAKQPITIVKNLQASFAGNAGKIVGGKVHDLTIMPDGRMFSDSGIVRDPGRRARQVAESGGPC